MIESGEKNRRFNGVVLEARVQVGGAEVQTSRLFATDIAKSGLFLEWTDPPPVGAVIRLLLAVLPGKMLPVDARVMRTVSSEEASRIGVLPGIGVKFENLTVAARELIDRALESAQQAVIPDPVPEIPIEAVEPIAETTSPSFLVRRMADEYKARKDEMVRKAREFEKAGRQALKEGTWVRASAELQTALSFDPENEELKALLKEAHDKACRAKAITAWSQGEYQESLGDRKSAALQFREAATLDPANPEYTRKAAAYAFTDGDLKHARQWLMMSLAAKGDDPDSRALLAMVYEAAGHLHNALKEAERAQQIAPTRRDIAELVKRLKRA